MSNNKVAVLFLIFNRKDHALEALKYIKEYKPLHFYIAADGPRYNKEGEEKACAETRTAVLNAIDWDCEVRTLFRSSNLGCAEAVNGAINWFFETEEKGIIIEDDVLVSMDFYRMCEDLLERYSDVDKVMEISARNESYRTDINNSYVYAQCYHCWGWATWRRAWKLMDMTMSATNKLSAMYLIKRLGWFRGLMMRHRFKVAYNNIENLSSWATRWYLSILNHDGLVICPGVNLSINIGIDGGAHYQSGDENPYKRLKIGKIVWPLVYNDVLLPDKSQTKYDNKEYLRLRWIGAKKKLKKMIRKGNK